VATDFQRESVKTILCEQGIDWGDLRSRCVQIVLFGSRAVGAETKHSDVDLLCVGFGRRLKTDEVDLVWYTPEFILIPKWLGSELASHIAEFGVWLHGEDNWSKLVKISEDAIDFKRHLICRRIAAMERTWQQLAPDYRVKHVVKLRRDLQRFLILKAGRAIPATPTLDDQWVRMGSNSEAFLELLSDSKEPDLIAADQLRMIREYLPRLDWRYKSSATALA
jgi:Nucleotidyltransferase domain